MGVLSRHDQLPIDKGTANLNRGFNWDLKRQPSSNGLRLPCKRIKKGMPSVFRQLGMPFTDFGKY